MELDDSKYLLQLARADVLTVPESPGDWNSVIVKSPKEDGSTLGQDPSKRATMSPNTTRHPSGASPSGGAPARTPQTAQHSPSAAQKTSTPQTRENYSVPTPSEARRQVTGSKSPPPHKGRGEYRMALVSTIQPSFGTYPSEPSPKDEHMVDNPASEADR